MTSLTLDRDLTLRENKVLLDIIFEKVQASCESVNIANQELSRCEEILQRTANRSALPSPQFLDWCDSETKRASLMKKSFQLVKRGLDIMNRQGAIRTVDIEDEELVELQKRMNQEADALDSPSAVITTIQLPPINETDGDFNFFGGFDAPLDADRLGDIVAVNIQPTPNKRKSDEEEAVDEDEDEDVYLQTIKYYNKRTRSSSSEAYSSADDFEESAAVDPFHLYHSDERVDASALPAIVEDDEILTNYFKLTEEELNDDDFTCREGPL
jgi:hypothetical protein